MTFPWCSGHHVCLTHRRSPVRAWAETCAFLSTSHNTQNYTQLHSPPQTNTTTNTLTTSTTHNIHLLPTANHTHSHTICTSQFLQKYQPVTSTAPLTQRPTCSTLHPPSHLHHFTNFVITVSSIVVSHCHCHCHCHRQRDRHFMSCLIDSARRVVTPDFFTSPSRMKTGSG